MIQYYAPASTFLLAMAAIHWRSHGSLNKIVRISMVAGAVAGAILSAKVLPL